MHNALRIGTRESQLAVWQAETVKCLLAELGTPAELTFIKSEGDTDLTTPLYEIGVQGIFTRALDIALLKGDIDIAVHSMKDVPTMLAKGIVQVAVLPRASYKDILVPRPDIQFNIDNQHRLPVIATSSIRRKAQWLNKYPGSLIDNLRGNVNTRLRKVAESNWDGAIFAAAGLERINLRPANAVELDWMLPAPAQGAIVIVCRADDKNSFEQCHKLNDIQTEYAVNAERDFLRALMGGCATPISALAQVNGNDMYFQGSVLSPDGQQKAEVMIQTTLAECGTIGTKAAQKILEAGAREILDKMKND